MVRYEIRNQILQLDAVRDHQHIVFLTTCFEFPFDTTRALELALFRTFCVPSISSLLDRTGEFAERPQKRYDDTDIIVSELIEWGYDSDRGRRALRRMNRFHGRHSIANDDYLYVLSTFVFEPIRWNRRFGWRLMLEQERKAMFYFWREVGRRMGIQGIPGDYDAFEQFNRDYEARQFRYSDSNRRVGEATVELFASWFPRPLASLVRLSIYALLEPNAREAFGFPTPPRLWSWLLVRGLVARAWALRWLPPRRQPRLRTAMGHPSYPEGYTLDRLGPPDA